MPIQVEFYGIPRQRAGVAAAEVEAGDVRELIQALEAQFPDLAETCFEDGTFRSGYLANVNGAAFTRDLSTPLQPGDCVLILSADAGG